MALKEKALKRMCEKLEKAQVPFAVTGPWMLSVRGSSVAWHGFDVITDLAAFPDADKVLTRLGMRTPVSDEAERKEVHYHFDGADITLIAGLPVPYRLPNPPESVTVLGQAVPLLPVLDAYLIAGLTAQTSFQEESRAFLQKSGLTALQPEGFPQDDPRIQELIRGLS
ncbi:MAG: hypothetical protein IJ229_00200 [Clostridia bacterium]|nr:hypothetical protein [Clostridia bacterium]MBR1685489.1 hypothetical protein [Clostridia bacterium]